jgi:hypothetical protein
MIAIDLMDRAERARCVTAARGHEISGRECLGAAVEDVFKIAPRGKFKRVQIGDARTICGTQHLTVLTKG